MVEHKRLVRESGRRRRPLSIMLIGVLAAAVGAVVGAKLQPVEPRTPTWLELQRHVDDDGRRSVDDALLDSPACETRDGAAPILAHLVQRGVRPEDFPAVQRCLARTRDRAWVLGQLEALEPKARAVVVVHLNTPAVAEPAAGDHHVDRPARTEGMAALHRGDHPVAIARLRAWLARQPEARPTNPSRHEEAILAQLIVEALEARAAGGTR